MPRAPRRGIALASARRPLPRPARRTALRRATRRAAPRPVGHRDRGDRRPIGRARRRTQPTTVGGTFAIASPGDRPHPVAGDEPERLPAGRERAGQVRRRGARPALERRPRAAARPPRRPPSAASIRSADPRSPGATARRRSRRPASRRRTPPTPERPPISSRRTTCRICRRPAAAATRWRSSTPTTTPPRRPTWTSTARPTGCRRARAAAASPRSTSQAAPRRLPPASSDWDTEISLDLDTVSAICPNCHILLVEAASSYDSDLDAAMQTAARLGANQISDSWTLTASRDPVGQLHVPRASPPSPRPVTRGTSVPGYDDYPGRVPRRHRRRRHLARARRERRRPRVQRGRVVVTATGGAPAAT